MPGMQFRVGPGSAVVHPGGGTGRRIVRSSIENNFQKESSSLGPILAERVYSCLGQNRQARYTYPNAVNPNGLTGISTINGIPSMVFRVGQGTHQGSGRSV